jgi:hypothetical protein
MKMVHARPVEDCLLQHDFIADSVRGLPALRAIVHLAGEE